MVRQFADETDRIGQKHIGSVRQLQLARGRIKRGKQLVLGKNARVGQTVEQCRLARVGVTDNCNLGQPAPIPRRANGSPTALQCFQLGFQRGDSALHVAAVGFQFRFARSARSDAAAQTGQFRPLADQARCGVFQLRQLHL